MMAPLNMDHYCYITSTQGYHDKDYMNRHFTILFHRLRVIEAYIAYSTVTDSPTKEQAT